MLLAKREYGRRKSSNEACILPYFAPIFGKEPAKTHFFGRIYKNECKDVLPFYHLIL